MYNQHSSQNYKVKNKIFSFINFDTNSHNQVYLFGVILKQKQKQKQKQINIFCNTRVEKYNVFYSQLSLKTVLNNPE